MSAISRIYIETNWETFIRPYYDLEEDKVYFTYYTEITKLSPTETWQQFFAKYEPEVIKFFKQQEYSLLPGSLDEEPPKIKFPVFEKDEKEICKLDGEKPKQIPSKFMFEYGRKTVDPRPDGVVKLSYVVNNASKFLNIEKINLDFQKFVVETRAIPPGLSKPIAEPKDFNIQNYKDFSKVKNINSLKDANDFLGAALAKTNNARMAAKIGLSEPSQAVNLEFSNDFRESLRKDIKINGLAVTDESLSAARNVTDTALHRLNFLTSTTAALKAYGYTEKAAELEKIRKQVQDKLGVAVNFVNKWGLSGLLECLFAQLIKEMELAGDIEKARKLALELQRLQENTTEIALQYNDIKKIFQKGFNISGGFRNLAKKEGVGDKIVKELKAAAEAAVIHSVQAATQACLINLTEDDSADDFDFGAVGPEIFPTNLDTSPALPPDFTGAPGTGEPPNPTQIQDFLRDILANITKKELCRLLQGAADNKLLFFIQTRLKKHPAMASVFKEQQSLAVYFYNLGLQIDIAFCKPSKSPITPNSNLVSYCGSKVNETLADLYKEKLPNPDVQPDLPSISVADLQEALSPDFFQSLVPPIDFTPFLRDSYRQAQEDLFSYESLFNKDVLNKIQAPTQKTTKKLSSKQKKEQDDALEDAGLEPDGGSGKNTGDLKLNKSITNSINEINIENFPNPNLGSLLSKAKIDPSKEFVLFEGGPFAAVNILSDGAYDIESELELPFEGATTDKKQSPLFMIGEAVKKSDPEQQTPELRVIEFDEADADVPVFTVLDYYRDVMASVVDFYLSNMEARVKQVIENPAEFLQFYRLARRERVKETLCEAGDNKEEAQEYAADNQKAMDIESIRILVFTLIIERYINMIVLASSGLPKSIADGLLTLPKDAVNLIAFDFLILCEESIVEIPVRKVLCDAGLSVEQVINEELKFVQESIKFGLPLPPVETVILEKTNLTGEQSFLFEPFDEMKNFMIGYVGEGEPINAAGETKKLNLTELYQNDIAGKLEAYDGSKLPKVEERVLLMLAKSAGQYAPDVKIPLSLLPAVVYGFITVLYNMIVNDANATIDTNNAMQVANKINDLFLKHTYTIEYDVTVTYSPEYIQSDKNFDIYDTKKVTSTKLNPSLITDVGNLINSNNPLNKKFKLFQTLSPKSIVTSLVNEPAIDQLKGAFSADFASLLAKYFIKEYSLKQQGTKIFDQTKAAIISRFSIGTPVLATYDQSVQAYEQQIADLNNPNLKLANMTTQPLWLIIILMIPKLIFSALKSIIMAALYFSNPIVYFVLMTAESLGLSLPDYLDKLREEALKKTAEEIEAAGKALGLETNNDPALAKVKFDLKKIREKQQKNSSKSIVDLKCDI